jgi:hypothetical protein
MAAVSSCCRATARPRCSCYIVAIKKRRIMKYMNRVPAGVVGFYVLLPPLSSTGSYPDFYWFLLLVPTDSFPEFCWFLPRSSTSSILGSTAFSSEFYWFLPWVLLVTTRNSTSSILGSTASSSEFYILVPTLNFTVFFIPWVRLVRTLSSTDAYPCRTKFCLTRSPRKTWCIL